MAKIFYSWQSDLASQKAYLQECLELALQRIPSYEIETATRNSKGAVDISQTLLKKIDESNMFLADVSIINPDSKDRPTPNPNVLYELGYAIGKNGEAGIILIANSKTTSLEKLPFDIRNRRIISKKFNESSKQALANELFEIISSHIPIEDEDAGPYIYLKVHAAGSQGLIFTAYNDENQIYQIEAIELGGTEQDLSYSLNPKSETPNISTSSLPQYPFEDAFDELSFVVTRRNKSYRIHQRLVVSERADEKFNLDRLDPNPVLIEAIPKRRKVIVRMNHYAGKDGESMSISDITTGNIFYVSASNSLLTTWELPATLALEKLGKAINDQHEGRATGEFLLTTYNSVGTVDETVTAIYKGTLFSNSQGLEIE